MLDWDNGDITGFVQASMSKIQELFKDFKKPLQQFQGLNVNKKYWSKC